MKIDLFTEVESKPRYSDEDLAEFKEIVISRISEANHYLFDLERNEGFKVLPEHSMSINEIGSLIIRQKKYISFLNAALQRIENKTYGICRATSKLISKERLKKIPHATLAINEF